MEQQARSWWQRTRPGRPWRDEYWRQAQEYSRRAELTVGPEVLTFLAERRISVHFTHDDPCIAGVRMRAVFDGHKGSITIYERAVDELALLLPAGKEARDLILAHEAFHVAEPDCPAHLAELSAHLYASRHAGLEIFAGHLE